jgi:hypothetical protein
LQEEEGCLDILRRAHQIRFKRRRWVVAEQRTVDTLGGQLEGKDPRGFWLDVARASWGQGMPGVYSYNICSLSEDDFGRLQALHRRFFAEMREIVARSTPNQRVALVATQIIGFGAADVAPVPNVTSTRVPTAGVEQLEARTLGARPP